MKAKKLEADAVLIAVAHDGGIYRYRASLAGDLEFQTHQVAQRQRGIQAHRATAQRKIGCPTLALNYGVPQSHRKIDADTQMLAPLLVNPGITDSGLKNFKRVVAKLAAKRVDVEKSQQTLIYCDSAQALDEFSRAIWASDDDRHTSFSVGFNEVSNQLKSTTIACPV
ncbi:MAG TPA: hypothetical protein VNT76_13725 [Candidatus Binatus sp.]|nr:hypothetical protein [Candidatus Binatus sp.]